MEPQPRDVNWEPINKVTENRGYPFPTIFWSPDYGTRRVAKTELPLDIAEALIAIDKDVAGLTVGSGNLPPHDSAEAGDHLALTEKSDGSVSPSWVAMPEGEEGLPDGGQDGFYLVLEQDADGNLVATWAELEIPEAGDSLPNATTAGHVLTLVEKNGELVAAWKPAPAGDGGSFCPSSYEEWRNCTPGIGGGAPGPELNDLTDRVEALEDRHTGTLAEHVPTYGGN